jgi:hypothetical protein
VDDHPGRVDGRGGLAGLLQDLARSVADVRLRRADVDQVGGVDVDIERRLAKLGGLGVGRGLLVGAGVGEEDLQAVGVELGGGVRELSAADVGSEWGLGRDFPRIGDVYRCLRAGATLL